MMRDAGPAPPSSSSTSCPSLWEGADEGAAAEGGARIRGGVWAEASFRGDGGCDGDDEDKDDDEDEDAADEDGAGTKAGVDAGAPAGADDEDAVNLGALLGCAAAALLVAAGTLPKELPRLAKAAPSAVAGIQAGCAFCFPARTKLCSCRPTHFPSSRARTHALSGVTRLLLYTVTW